MQIQNNYIGDDKFTKLLEHYKCPAPLSLIRMRFAGAMCSPNLNLRPTDVIASLWPDGQEPRLQTKEEADLFFKFFMGFWDEIFRQVTSRKFKLPLHKIITGNDLTSTCRQRALDVEDGFLEGFWGGLEDADLPEDIAEIIDSVSELVEAYGYLGNCTFTEQELNALSRTVTETDEMVNRCIDYIIENYALPRFKK